jgi:hypothetical protein
MQTIEKQSVNTIGLVCGPCVGSPPSESEKAPRPVPWVSTDLRILRPEPTWRLAPDFTTDERCYRKLDPEYFAWLRSRMLEVKAAHKAGRVPQAAFDELRTRFNELQEVAIALFGQQALQDALRAPRVAEYRPPALDAFPGRSAAKLGVSCERAARPDSARYRAAAESAVDAVRGQALEVGWTRESLYGRSAPGLPGIRRDLVTAICRPGTRIGQITRQWIEIIGPPPHENILRLYNPDVEQPWVKHVGPRPGGDA